MGSIPNPSILDPQPKPLWCVLQRPAAIRHCHSAASEQLLQLLMDFSDWPSPLLLRRVVPSILHSSEDVRGCSRWLWLLKLSVNRSYGPYCAAVSIAAPHRAWDPHFWVSTSNLTEVRQTCSHCPNVAEFLSSPSDRGLSPGIPWRTPVMMNFQPVMLSDPHLAPFHSPRPCSLEGRSVLPPVWNKADLSMEMAASAPPLGGAWWGEGAASSTTVSYLHFWPNPSPSATSAPIHTCSILSFWSHHKTVAEFQG